MKPAAEKLAELLATTTIKKGAIPVIHNVSVAIAGDSEAIKTALVQQLYSPVRWVETVQHMGSMGVTTLIECGPGKVLAGLNKRIDKNIETVPVYDDASLDKAQGFVESASQSA